MLQVMELEGVRFRKYVLQNQWTGIILPNKRQTDAMRFWTVRGAQRSASRRVRSLNTTFRKLASGTNR